MAEGMRPGGLTALAVLNFVIGGLFGLFRLLGLAGTGIVPDAELEKLQTTRGTLFLLLTIGLVSCGLLITSGVGYIKQKRVLGRMMGNVYVACSLSLSVLELVLGNDGLTILTLVGVIYPLLTLFLINTTFKDDLVN